MAGKRWTKLLAGALISGLTIASVAPAMAQGMWPLGPDGRRYYDDGYRRPPPPRYYRDDDGWRQPRYYRRAAVSRVCATDAGICYQRPQEIGTWCKCGGGPTRSTGSIIPER